MKFTHASLFSGIGGFDLAAEWMGWENIFHCEWNPFCQKILSYHFPNSKSYHDITKTDFTIHRGTIDILTGGFPCQPFSLAGEQKGTEDNRHLWPEMLRAIREIQPRFVVGENVFGLVNWNGGMVFDQVQTDLEAEGYEVWPYVLPAVAVDAPHRRDRIWFIACIADSDGNTERSSGTGRSAKSNGGKNDDEQKGRRSKGKLNIGRCIFLWNVADSGLSRQEISKEQTTRIKQRYKRNASNSDSFVRGSESQIRMCSKGTWGESKGIFENINGNAGRTRRKEQHLPGVAATPGFSNREYYANIGNFDKFPTQSPVCNGDDGVSTKLDGITFPKWRNESIKGGGNAIVPQVALQLFKAIDEFKKLYYL